MKKRGLEKRKVIEEQQQCTGVDVLELVYYGLLIVLVSR
jgi:hypothetical protein